MGTQASLSEIKHIYDEAKTIAVVGASDDPTRAAHNVPAYLQEQGYRIIPVNPRHTELLGEKSYASLADIEEPVDVVDVFRPAGEAPAIARLAAELGAGVFWLQLGIESDEAAEIAFDSGMQVVMNRCMGQMHAKLGLGPGPIHGV
jgi:predicted CoA-binding protein